MHQDREFQATRKRCAGEFQPGQAIPEVPYSAEEDELWSMVFDKLSGLHEALACEQYRRSAGRVLLPADRVPQLPEVSERIAPLTGFTLHPAWGIIPSEAFYSGFAGSVFQTSLYLRPVSAQFHSPLPDIIHEMIGHAAMLADPEFAGLYRCFGRAAQRAESAEVVEMISRLFWFSLENGLILENSQPRACGAAILSSVAEMESFPDAELRDFVVADIVAQNFDDSHCQPVLFVANSAAQMIEDVRNFLERVR